MQIYSKQRECYMSIFFKYKIQILSASSAVFMERLVGCLRNILRFGCYFITDKRFGLHRRPYFQKHPLSIGGFYLLYKMLIGFICDRHFSFY